MCNSVPGTRERYPDLIDVVREKLRATGKPYVIENVPGSPLNPTVVLCGTQFGKRIRLHRLFETSFPVDQPMCDHSLPALNPHNAEGRRRIRAEFPGELIESGVWATEKGMPGVKGHELREAIPPAYTEYIGSYLMDAVSALSLAA